MPSIHAATKTTRIGPEGHEQARLASRLTGIGVSDLVDQAVKEWVVRQKEKDPWFKEYFDRELEKTA
jgi:hypothetical protein